METIPYLAPLQSQVEAADGRGGRRGEVAAQTHHPQDRVVQRRSATLNPAR